MGEKRVDRAVLYIDGNNWYHFLRSRGVGNLLGLSYAKISHKLVGVREW